MTADDTKLLPADGKLSFFGFAFDLVRTHSALRFLFRSIGLVFFAISPEVPDTFCTTARKRPTYAGFFWGAGLTFFFCFIVTAVWNLVDGTFYGTDINRIYFSHDVTDLINFGVLCPLYVGFSVQLVVLLLHCWTRLANPEGYVVDTAPRLPYTSIGIGILLTLSIGAGVTVNYMRECLTPSVLPKINWWVGHVAPDGSRILNSLGIYYALLIFVLLSICLMAVLAFMSLFFLCVRFGKIVGNQPVESDINLETLRDTLSDFTQAYIVLKLLAVVLVFNVYTWKIRFVDPRASLNFIAMCVAIVLFGVFLISAPRYYIELEWYRFRELRSLVKKSPENRESDDVRSTVARKVALVTDTLVLSGFFASFLSLWL